jgi:hypothetical protein
VQYFRLAAERQRIRELLQRSEVAMFVTFDGGDAHSGRPMLRLRLQKDPHICFLTHRHSRKVADWRTPASGTHGRQRWLLFHCARLSLHVSRPCPDPPALASELSSVVSRGDRGSRGHRSSDGHQHSELLGTAEKPGSPGVPSGESSRHSSSGRDSHEDDRSMVNESPSCAAVMARGQNWSAGRRHSADHAEQDK